MTAWWYQRGDAPVGPVDAGALRTQWQAGAVGDDTLVWREGMAGWQRLDAIAEFDALRADALRPVSTSAPMSAPAPAEAPHLAGPWARWCARMLDTLFAFVLIVWMVDGYLWLTKGLRLWIGIEVGVFPPVILGLLLLLMPVLDALIVTLFGNTPFKALLGVRVVGPNGRRLSFGASVLRNMQVAIVGSGLMVGLIAVAAMAWQWHRVRRGLPANYDNDEGRQVLGRRVTMRDALRVIAVVGLIALMQGGQIYLNKRVHPRADAVPPATAKAEPRAATTAPVPLPAFTWRNPVTQVSVRIDGAWRFSESTNRDGDPVSLFLYQDEKVGVSVTLGTERLTHVSLTQYALGFMENNDKRYKFDGPGHLVRAGNVTKWVGIAQSRKHPELRAQVEITQRGQRFWYLVAVLDRPYERHAAELGVLRDALATSIAAGSDASM